MDTPAGSLPGNVGHFDQTDGHADRPAVSSTDLMAPLETAMPIDIRVIDLTID
jgi:hypothetical protein